MINQLEQALYILCMTWQHRSIPSDSKFKSSTYTAAALHKREKQGPLQTIGNGVFAFCGSTKLQLHWNRCTHQRSPMQHIQAKKSIWKKFMQ